MGCRRHFLGRWTWMSALSLMALVLAAGPVGAGEPKKVLVATTPGGAATFLYHVAMKKGLDLRHGVKIEAKVMNPPEGERAVVYRAVDSYSMPTISALRANLRGNRVRIVAPMIFLHTSVLVAPDAPYRRLEELRGKRLGSLDRITAAYVGLNMAAQTLGLQLERDFRMIIAGSGQVLIGLLARREVDAITMFEVFTTRMIADGEARELLPMNEHLRQAMGRPFMALGVGAHQDWIDADRARATGFSRAILDTLNYIHANPEVIAEERGFLGLKTEPQVELAKARLLRLYPRAWDTQTVDDAVSSILRAMEMGLVERVPEADVRAIFWRP